MAVWLSLSNYGFAQTPYTYSNSSSGNIPDNSNYSTALVRTFNVTSNFSVDDLNVGLRVGHSYRGNIYASLTSPSGTVVHIVTSSSDNNSNYNILLNDEGTGPLNDGDIDNTGALPYYNRSVDVNALSIFEGELAQGIWTLRIWDVTSGYVGSYYSSELRFTGSVPVDPCDALASGNLDSDGDNVSDSCDLDDDNDGILDVSEGYCSTSGPVLLEKASASATGIGSSGRPNLSFNAPTTGTGGRMLLLYLTFERDHTPTPYADNWESTAYSSGVAGMPDVTFGGVNMNKLHSTFAHRGVTTDESTAKISNTQYIYLLWDSSIPSGTNSFNLSNFNLPKNAGDEWNATVVLYDNVKNIEYVNYSGFSSGYPTSMSVIGNMLSPSQPAGVPESNNTLMAFWQFSNGNGKAANSSSSWKTIDSQLVQNSNGSFATDPGTTGPLVGSSENDGFSSGISTITGVSGSQTFTATFNTSNALVGGLLLFRIVGNACTPLDSDSDGTPDYLDLDSDNDGCSDAFEAGNTSDLSLNYKFTGSDSNGDGLVDEVDADNNGSPDNPQNLSQPYDGVSACIDPCSDPAGTDSDGDGINDTCDLDDDNDGIFDLSEGYCSPTGPVLLKTATATATGSGTGGRPNLSFSAPSTGTGGRMLLLYLTFERDHTPTPYADNWESTAYSSGVAGMPNVTFGGVSMNKLRSTYAFRGVTNDGSTAKISTTQYLYIFLLEQTPLTCQILICQKVLEMSGKLQLYCTIM